MLSHASGKNMVRQRIKGILFDFDGTLTCPGAIDFSGIKRKINCPEELPILEFLETLTSSRRDRCEEILEAMEIRAAEASTPNVGAERCIRALKKKGLLLGILTRNSLRSVQIALDRFERTTINDFDVVITRGDSHPKPHPQGVHRAAATMGIASSDLMVVGDFRFDIMAGHAAGTLTMLLTNGKETVMVPGDPEPDYTIGCLEEMLGIL